MSVVSSASSGSGRSNASSKRCRYFTARLPGPLASRTQPLRESRSSAPRIVGSSYSTTGSRFDVWLHASRSAFSESGYTSGVVRCFSTRLPRTRISTGSACTPLFKRCREVPEVAFGILGRVAPVAVGLVAGLLRDLGAGLARAGAVRVDVLDVDVDERRTADRLRAPVVAARAAEEDRRAVADVHLRVCDLAVRAREAVLLPEAEGPC